MLIQYRRRDKLKRTFLFSPSMRDRLKGLRQVDGKKGSSADLLDENFGEGSEKLRPPPERQQRAGLWTKPKKFLGRNFVLG